MVFFLFNREGLASCSRLESSFYENGNIILPAHFKAKAKAYL